MVFIKTKSKEKTQRTKTTKKESKRKREKKRERERINQSKIEEEQGGKEKKNKFFGPDNVWTMCRIVKRKKKREEQ